MKNKALLTFLIFFIFVASAAVSSAGTETQLTNGERLTQRTAIFGNYVFWTETTGNGVHAFDLTSGKRTDIDGHAAHSQINSYGNKVVWTGDDGDAVYMYDISTGNETKISSGGRLPDIYGNYVVYTNNYYYGQDHQNDGIYLYDLNTHNETKIATVYSSPAIHDKKVVWSQENSNNAYDVHLYDISTQQTSTLTTTNSSVSESELDIYGNVVVWTESGNVSMYDIASHTTTQVTNSGNAYQPAIYGNWIVYTIGDPYSGDGKDIYLYEISTARTTRITTSTLAFAPSVYGDKIVYADCRNNPQYCEARDIYLYDLSNTSNDIVASFTSNVSSGIAPLNVSFTDISTGTPNAWYWDFGDGATSNKKDPTHTYFSAGNYTACLTVSNANGTDSKLATITVIRPAVYAYITSFLGVYVIDTTTNTVTTRINAGRTHGVAVSSDGTKVYVTNSDSDGIVSVIDASTNTVTARVKVGAYPNGVAVSPDGTNVYVANWRSGNISVIDTSTNTIKATVNLGGNPCGVAVSPDGKKVYVTNWHDHAMSVIDAATNNIITTVPVVGDSSYGVVVSPDGKKVYVANYEGKNISVIDTTTDTVAATIEVGYGPRGIAVSPDGKKVYVANEDKTVSIIDTATNKIIAVVNMISEPFGIAVTPDGKSVYVANTGEYYEDISNFDHNVSVIDTATNTVKTTVEVGERPIAFGQFIGRKPVLESVLPVDAPVAPVADFSTNVTSGYTPLSVQFTDRSENATLWNWDFGDGTNSTQQNPTHIYSAAGTYTVNLTVSNANGTASEIAAITVLESSSISGSGSDSSGGGGGGGGSPEPATNVEAKEVSQAFISSGSSVKFDFPQKATPVVYVSFDSKKTAGKTKTIAEMLKAKSTLVSEIPSGEVYKSLNIWVGNSGFATSKNIENAVVCFKVEKSWIKDKSINQSSVTLNRVSDNKWNQLPTNLSGEDDKYLYFTAQTPGFSPFAITGKSTASGTGTRHSTENKTQSAVDDTQNKPTTGSTAANVEQIPEQKQSPNTSGKESTKTPAFEIAYGIVCLLSVFLYKRR